MRKMKKIIAGIVLGVIATGLLIYLPVLSVQEILENAPYDTDDWNFGDFDCSNMAMLMKDYLAYKGIETYLVRGVDKDYHSHYWVESP